MAGPKTILRAVIPAAVALAALSPRAGLGQDAVSPATPVTPQCQAGGTSTASESPLPTVAAALQQRESIRILAVGGSSARGAARGGYTAMIEQFLERTVRGLDVEIVNRGFSGELAEAGAQRIKVEVGLTEPDLVLWQVGTNDALAYVPLDRLTAVIEETVRWLKEHKVDVVLVGLQYVDQMARDEHYQAVRQALREIAKKENVIVVRRYEAMKFIAEAQASGGGWSIDEFERAESGYACLAQYNARAISVGLFAKNLPNTPSWP